MGFFRKKHPASAGADTVPTSTHDPLDHVVPAVRTQTAIQLQQLRHQVQGQPALDIPTQPFAGNLHVALVQNRPDFMAYVDQPTLADWGTTFDELYPRALANLRALSDETAISAATVDGGGKRFTALGTDDFLGTRLLTFEHLARIPMPQLILAINPERNVVILADATSPEAMIQAFDNAKEFADGPGFVSLRPIIGDGTSWMDLELPEGHPAKGALHDLHLADRALQANILGPELQHLVGTGTLVEAVMHRSEDSRTDTVTCWREGQPGLIAETDTIAFVRQDPNEPILYASWAAVNKVAGMLMNPTSFDGRWKLAAFPSDEQFEQMGARPLAD